MSEDHLIAPLLVQTHSSVHPGGEQRDEQSTLGTKFTPGAMFTPRGKLHSWGATNVVLLKTGFWIHALWLLVLDT
jgi:hypothetical protein